MLGLVATAPDRSRPVTLTDGERVLLRLLVRGYSHADAARELRLAVTDVEHLLSSISSKLHLSDRLEVQEYAVAIGLLNRNGSGTS